MTPYLILDPAQRRALGRHLAILRDAEYAHATAHFDNLDAALAGVDPVELKALICVIESAAIEPEPGPFAGSSVPPPRTQASVAAETCS